MFRVRRVEIDGLWGGSHLETDLHDDVNIFVGPNGSGKTIFVNCLEATLSADPELLGAMPFNEIRLRLFDGRRRRVISVTKTKGDYPYGELLFKIGRFTHQLPLVPRRMESRRMEYRMGRSSVAYYEELAHIRARLHELVNISWLSVHRDILEDEYRESSSARNMPDKNPVDRRIDDLASKLIQYQLKLQSAIVTLSDGFRRDVLASLLYSKEFDSFSLDQLKPNMREIQDGLTRTYSDLGVLSTEIVERIAKHIEVIEKSHNAVVQFQAGNRDQKRVLSIDDILPIALLRRTQRIVDLSANLEAERRSLLRAVDGYLETLSEFMLGKTFQLYPNLSGELLVSRNETRLSLAQLSSGEKQLFILLTETLLQQQEQFIFIADEPELSLHIEWQEKILSSIRNLNPNSQIVVATHAPTIAAEWSSKIINMEDIIHD
ncbi:AAA family ATPase [Chloroflexota bacterium]